MRDQSMMLHWWVALTLSMDSCADLDLAFSSLLLSLPLSRPPPNFLFTNSEPTYLPSHHDGPFLVATCTIGFPC